MNHSALTICIIVLSVSISSTGHVLLKFGLSSLALEQLEPENTVSKLLAVASQPWLMLGLLFHVAALFVWLVALRRADITFAYPFLALGYVLVSLLGTFWLGETLNASRVAGMVLIVVGIIVLSRGG